MSKINEELSGYRCFICWDDIDFEDTSTKIVSACNCISKDFKYTHKDCLNLWINQNRHSGLKCQVCSTPFHIKKVYKPLKKIYKENWKKINCLICGMILINALLWMLCFNWFKEIEKINRHNHYENSEYENLTKYDEWINDFDERETYIEEYINEYNFPHSFKNFYFNTTTLFLFVNSSIIFMYFYHEKEKFIEYSIDEKYEFKNKSSSKYFKIINHDDNSCNLPKNELFSENKGSNNNISSNINEYQKIRII